MANDLRMRLVLDLADKALAPLKRIGLGARSAADGLRATRDRLRELNANVKNVDRLADASRNLVAPHARG